MNIEDVRALSPIDRLLYWVTERESIRVKKECGNSSPWTDDQILYRGMNMDGRKARWGTWLERFTNGFSRLGDNECWIWNGVKDSSGYGQIKVNGIYKKAHRVSYSVFVGSIGGMCVLHSCDNPGCVNPNHLWLGTKADNTADMIQKGRDNFRCGKGANNPRRGESNHMAVLTEEVVSWIRKVYIPRHKEFGQGALSRKFGVGQASISRIITRRCWKHVD